jgi:hypothetical protein
VTVGLVVNRSERFYPSWEALTGNVAEQAPVAPAPVPDGLLDGWLRERAGPDGAVTVPWQADGAAAWHLRTTPTLVVPAGYLDRSSTYPAVVSILDARQNWDAARTTAMAQAAVAAAGPAILLTATPSAQTTGANLATGLTAELARDLRVTPHGWALVAPVADAARAMQLIAGSPGRFGSLTLVGDSAAAALPPTLPPQLTVALVRTGPAAAPADAAGGAVTLSSARGAEWATALSWAFRQTPAPLAPPVTVPSLPSLAEAPR